MGRDDHEDGRPHLRRLISSVSVERMAVALEGWLDEAHRVAFDLQRYRIDERGGDWSNTISFGTDRYQYLLHSAPDLVEDLPVQVERPYRSLLIKLGDAAVYPFRMDNPPYGSVRVGSDLRRDMLAPSDEVELALLARTDVLTGDRTRVLLPWKGSEDGLDCLWAGKGVLNRNGTSIDWEWLTRLVPPEVDEEPPPPVPNPRSDEAVHADQPRDAWLPPV